jgi:hypothetical protein
MPLSIRTFAGEVPALDPRLLPESAAQTAENVRLDRGTLRPLRQPATAATLGADAQTIIRHGGAWLGFDAIVDAVPGPVADDRLYITGDGVPKLLEDGDTRDLALPAPTGVPSVTLDSGGTGDVESTTFAYTFLTDLGEESPPSPLSGAFDMQADDTATIGGFSTPPTGRGVTHYRIYKSVTSLTGTTGLFFVAEHAVGAGSFDYDPAAHPIQEAIATTDYSPAPDGMEGIISMPNGMMAAFVDREVLFCEPFLPHSWPLKYRLKVDYPIVGLASFGTMLAIMTEGTPYRAEGVHPELMQMEKIEADLPCVAARSIVDLGYAAVYASTEGLVEVTPAGARNITRGLLTQDQWSLMDPSSFVAAQWEGLYVASYDPLGAAGRELAMFDLRGQVPSLTRADIVAADLHRDIATGKLYALVGTTDVQQVHGDSSDDATYTWRSKLYDLPYPVNFSTMKVEGSASTNGTPAYSVKIYADGDLKLASTTLNAPFRLSSDFLAEEWEIQIEGNATITRVAVGETMGELALMT